MNALEQARIEIERLEIAERSLMKQLSTVRLALETRRSFVAELIRQRSAPIDRLPAETLLCIMELLVLEKDVSWQGGEHHRGKMKLAGVSRKWRQIINNYPKFWTNIKVTPKLGMICVKTHIERSQQRPLNIIIRNWIHSSTELPALLDVIVPHIHRWRTLDISEINQSYYQVILDAIHNSTFPSLICATVAVGGIYYPNFLRPENSPALETLRLSCLIPSEDLPPTDQRLSKFILKFSDHEFGSLAFPTQLLSQKLTTLSIDADQALPPIPENSISLPFLTSLTIVAFQPGQLIRAVVVPRLTYFCLEGGEEGDPLSVVFDGLQSKFSSVHNLVLRTRYVDIQPDDGEAICLAFPNASVVEICPGDIPALFSVGDDDLCPADYLTKLSCVTFDCICIPYQLPDDDLIYWLNQRQQRGQPKLCVKFISLSLDDNLEVEGIIEADDGHGKSEIDWLSERFDSLRHLCTLELVKVQLSKHMVLTSASGTPPVLVRIPLQMYCLLIHRSSWRRRL
ncbi:hypothetical protein ID866_5868 [Astraeus odoratus]|nr:hypothetical protein ID866_5868 [Astraeus odoratus]